MTSALQWPDQTELWREGTKIGSGRDKCLFVSSWKTPETPLGMPHKHFSMFAFRRLVWQLLRHARRHWPIGAQSSLLRSTVYTDWCFISCQWTSLHQNITLRCDITLDTHYVCCYTNNLSTKGKGKAIMTMNGSSFTLLHKTVFTNSTTGGSVSTSLMYFKVSHVDCHVSGQVTARIYDSLIVWSKITWERDGLGKAHSNRR